MITEQGTEMPKLIDERRIFNAAINELMVRGYDGATTREIADIAGVNEVTLFRKYRNKAGLFAKAVEFYLSDTPLNKVVFSGELEADLLKIVEAYVETNDLYGNIVPILLIELPRNPDLRGSLDTPWNNLQGIIQIIRKYQDDGLLRNESPIATVSALIGPIMIGQMFRRAGMDQPVPVPDPQAHVHSFLNGRGL
jgi:AcrR family transcriptional regulator